MKKLTRRDFIKIAGATLASAVAMPQVQSLGLKDTSRANIILIVMDAFSAQHLSLYGYPRATTPNIDAFANRCTVYHRHYSGSNFTTSGTASMLTGMLPWKHGATVGGSLVRPEFVGTNPYTLLGADYFRFAFCQNTWPDRLVGQYYQDVDRFLSPYSYSLLADDPLMWVFKNDRTIGDIFANDLLFAIDEYKQLPGSPILGYLNKSHRETPSRTESSPSYSGGFPKAMNKVLFRNEEIYRGVYQEISKLHNQAAPYFAYFHLFSPHSPYISRNDYRKLFHDKYKPVEKPNHPLQGLYPNLPVSTPKDVVLSQNTLYDRVIAQIDDEFGKLISNLERSGALENTYVILTSDHGELFERGYVGHGDLFMYEPVIHVPLMIYSPKASKRQDIFSPTSNTDILPTLLAIAGKAPAPDMDGKPLPGFGGKEDPNRPIFSTYSLDNSTFKPTKKAVFSMHKGNYKIIVYLGYTSEPVFELYDIANDPNELINLADKNPQVFFSMKDEIFTYLEETNQRFKQS